MLAFAYPGSVGTHHVFVSPSVDVPAGVEFPAPWETGEWAGGDRLTEITVPDSGGVGWRFENGVYVRYQDGEPHQILVFHNGEVVSGNWFRVGQAEAYVFTAEDGEVIPIPGDSRYLAVVPADALLNLG